MKIVHPDFDTPMKLMELDAYKDEGVYCSIPSEEKKKLNYFLTSFKKFRTEKNQRITNASLYPNLPFSIKDKSWKSKQKDIGIIDKICRTKTSLKVLDIGGWNGWLSNYLTLKGHSVVVTDIFLDTFDGLKAVNHYEKPFLALQLFPSEIWRIQESFDLIIFNRNWAYIENHSETFSIAKSKLAKNGTILFTGLTFYKNAYHIEKQLAESTIAFEKKYGIPLLYFPTKGYLNHDDFMFLKKEAELYPYNAIKSLFNKILLSQKNHQFAIYKKDETEKNSNTVLQLHSNLNRTNR